MSADKPEPEWELDGDGYPPDEALEAIANWPVIGDGSEARALMAAIRPIWRWDFGWVESDANEDNEPIRVYRMATGGWSGNESIIGALRQNIMFWSLYWQESHRGGLFIFTVPDRSKR